MTTRRLRVSLTVTLSLSEGTIIEEEEEVKESKTVINTHIHEEEVKELSAELNTYIQFIKETDKQLKFLGYYEYLLNYLNACPENWKSIREEFLFRKEVDELGLKVLRNIPEEKDLLKKIWGFHIGLNPNNLPNLDKIRLDVARALLDLEYVILVENISGSPTPPPLDNSFFNFSTR